MENKTKINWWAMLASLMTGVLIGVVGSAVVKKLLSARKYRHMEREGFDYCDYDEFDDLYDDELQYKEEFDDFLDETEALSF